MEDNADGKRQAPAGWLEALERSQADLAAGRTVDGAVIMARLRQTLDEMEQSHKESSTAYDRSAAR